MATTHQILSNFSLSAPATSPTLTISGSVTTVSYDVSIQVPTTTGDSLTLDFQKSTDGGATWQTFYEFNGASGLNKLGQQATDTISGEIDNLAVGNKLRVTAPVCTGTWTLSASITQS